MKKEIWVPAIYIQKTGKKIDFTGLYEVSNLGNVRTLKQRKGIMIQLFHKGYLSVGLTINKKTNTYYVHRLVLSSFNPDGWFKGATVNHKSEIKTENFLENLEWMSHKDNVNFGTCIERRTVHQTYPVIRYTNNEYVDEYQSAAEAERITGICASSITAVCKGKRKTAGGSTWKYKN